jgi:chromosome segregation ATPase
MRELTQELCELSQHNRDAQQHQGLLEAQFKRAMKRQVEVEFENEKLIFECRGLDEEIAKYKKDRSILIERQFDAESTLQQIYASKMWKVANLWRSLKMRLKGEQGW